MILIPVKNLGNAKQRLADVLDQRARTELAQTMLFDVLQTVASWRARPEVALVTGDGFAIELVKRFNFEVIPDTANLGVFPPCPPKASQEMQAAPRRHVMPR